MSQNAVEVMYVGRKDRKTDRTTNLVWEGLGSVVEATPLQWQALKGFTDAFLDVTKLDEKARTKAVESVKDQMRAERRAMQTRVLLSDASDDEIQDEWARRHESPLKVVKAKPKASPPAPDRRGAEGENPEDGEAVSRPTKPAEIVDAIVTAIRTLDVDKPELFDSEDNPTKEAVEAVLHYPISKSELKAGIAANLQLLAAS